MVLKVLSVDLFGAGVRARQSVRTHLAPVWVWRQWCPARGLGAPAAKMRKFAAGAPSNFAAGVCSENPGSIQVFLRDRKGASLFFCRPGVFKKLPVLTIRARTRVQICGWPAPPVRNSKTVLGFGTEPPGFRGRPRILCSIEWNTMEHEWNTIQRYYFYPLVV